MSVGHFLPGESWEKASKGQKIRWIETKVRRNSQKTNQISRNFIPSVSPRVSFKGSRAWLSTRRRRCRRCRRSAVVSTPLDQRRWHQVPTCWNMGNAPPFVPFIGQRSRFRVCVNPHVHHPSNHPPIHHPFPPPFPTFAYIWPFAWAEADCWPATRSRRTSTWLIRRI